MLCYGCCKIPPFDPGYWTTKGWQKIVVGGEAEWFCPECAVRVWAGDTPEFSGDWDVDDHWMDI